jgi:Mg-chelatase subunit ChlD
VAFSDTREILVSADVIAPSVKEAQKKGASNTSSIDFVAVIDRSGSMAGSPMRLVKESLQFVVDNLKNEDQFSIVSFGTLAEVNLQLTKMNSSGKWTSMYWRLLVFSQKRL